MEYSKTIYKLDSKGKERFLHVHTEGADLIQDSGIVGSEKFVTHRSTCKGKNIGRSNETTPEEQAHLEAASKIESKMTTGYFETIELAKNTVVILPMLAKDYKKEFKKITFPCYVQRKYDGMRMLAKKDSTPISRKGKDILTLSHIQAEIDTMSLVDMFDGEAYAHGKTFQENMKLIKKYRPGETEDVKYHVYDMVYPNMSFRSRCALLKALIENGNFKNIELVPTYLVNSEEELKKYHSQFVSEGYEGTIIRHSDAGYGVNKRDSQLLKYKDFIDLDAKVLDIVPSDKNPEQGVCQCEYKGKTFNTGMKFSHKEREEILTNKSDYIGKMANIRFFEYTDSGLPRFPVCIGFHEDR